MHKLLLYAVLFCFLFLGQPAWSQHYSAQYLNPSKGRPAQLQPFRLDLPAMYRYLDSFEEEMRTNLELEIAGRRYRLEVWRSPLLHPDYRLASAGKTQRAPFPAEKTLFLTGRIHGRDEIDVALTLNEHFLLGQIGDLMIEPAGSYHPSMIPADALVGYFASETERRPDMFCGGREKVKSQIEDLVEESLLLSKDQRMEECHTLELALAADYLAFQQFGDLYALQNYYLGILNMVRLTFDDEFVYELRIIARGFYVSDCPGCDPWTGSTNVRDLLAGFRDWGNAGGFGFSYDLASMWTGRVLNDSLAGLGYIGVVCESRRYNVLRNYTPRAGLLRTLQAHEIGHNLAAGHDPEEAPFIMAPAIADVDGWSDASRNTIERYLNLLLAQRDWCLGDCRPPEANFAPPGVVGCAPAQVQFVDGSTGEVTAWQWSFDGGTADSDTLPNPAVWYPQAGIFGAELRVSNASGEHIHREDTVVVIRDRPEAGFHTIVDTTLRSVRFQFTGAGAETYAWQFGDDAASIEQDPSHTYLADGEYEVRLIVGNECGADTSYQTIRFVAPLQAAILPQTSVGCAPLSVQFSDHSSGEIATRRWFFPGGTPDEATQANPQIRYDQPGIYDVRLVVGNGQMESEQLLEGAVIVSGPPQVSFTAAVDAAQRTVQFQYTGENAQSYDWQFGDGSGSQSANPSHTYAGSGAYEVLLTAGNDCGDRVFRQTIHIPARPTAAFSADILEACAPFTTTFTDQSQGEVAIRRWSFPGGEPATSGEAAPSVRYTRPGWYPVRLEAANAAGTDTLTREAYIRVLPGPEARFEVVGALGDTVFTFLNDSFDAVAYEWHFGDGRSSGELVPRHYYENDGVYEVQLIAVNGCGRDTTARTVQVLRPPSAAFEVLSQTGCSSKTVQFADRSRGAVTERTWTFEGGTPAAASEANPVVAYSQPGYYSVKLRVKNAAGETEVERTDLVYVPEAPTARFSVDYALGDSTVRFSNSSEQAASYLWDFGDGRQSTEAEPIHTYRQDGDYTIKLEAQNECRTSLMAVQVTVVTLPRAGFRANVAAGCAPLTVQFENASTENAETLFWQFPGGQPGIAYGEHPIVTYPQPGRYDVRLTAGNPAGEVLEEKQQWIEVVKPPQSAFQFEQDGPSVQFVNTSVGAETYRWSFGDGQTSEEASPRHSYQSPGAYEVQLTGTNDCGADTTTQALTVIINDTQAPVWQAAARLFPNPNTGQFALQLNVLPKPGARLRLWDHLGRLIREFSWDNALSNEQWIRIPGARPGLYLLELESAGERGYWRVIVAR
jgi:PKD repeat protein